MESREVIKRLREAGWVLVSVEGSHHHFKHPERRGKVTVPHPRKDLRQKTLRNIERASGVELR